MMKMNKFNLRYLQQL